MARGIIGGLEGDSGVELVRTCKMAVGAFFLSKKRAVSILKVIDLWLGEERGCREDFPEVG